MKKYTLNMLPYLALAICLVAGPVAAQEDIDRTVDAESDGIVNVENVAGSVIVTGWDRDEIEVTGTLGKGTERLDVIEKGDRVMIKVILPRGRNRRVKETHLEIKIPYGSSLDVETVSASIDVNDVTGPIDLESVSGDIVANGEVAEAEFETVSGSIQSFVETDRLAAASVSGEIEVEGVSGIVAVGTVSGEATVTARRLSRLRFETVSGELNYVGGLADDADFQIDSHSGEIVLSLVGDVDARFEIETFSGDIESDFGGKAQRTNKYSPGKELDFKVGSGSASVEIETFSGDVSVLEK